jgi:hypothetical protein
MVTIRAAVKHVGCAFALAALIVAPASGATQQQIHKKRVVRAMSFTPDDMIGSFTPAAADPKLTGTFGRLGATSGGFRFTPSTAPSYAGRSWSTRLALAGERSAGDTPRFLGAEQSVALDLAGSYALSRNFDVTGGVRYKVQRDRIELSDQRRDSQAVYLGTAFRF